MASNILKLPKPRTKGLVSVEEAIAVRRSVREFSPTPISLEDLSQLLWAAQGVTEPESGGRSAPSAGATYPLEIFVFVKQGGVKEVEAGVYRYRPLDHSLIKVASEDRVRALMEAALYQEFICEAAVNIVIAARYERTTARYGGRGVRYVHIEVGHVGQNISLEAVSLGLGSVMVGAFNDSLVKKLIDEAAEPVYIIPIGYKR
ncbi:MAG: SagB/ThcOx family dehydrogenase [Thaumarchaeota archaeon]|nr:SagB/ThcOx family dehydrogenase [Nitrososphaerota archaeon]